jgi:hypothetical protein
VYGKKEKSFSGSFSFRLFRGLLSPVKQKTVQQRINLYAGVVRLSQRRIHEKVLLLALRGSLYPAASICPKAPAPATAL